MRDKISIKRLEGVHPDLRKLTETAITNAEVDGILIRVTCGLRTAAEQMEAYKNKSSKLSGVSKILGGTGISEHQKGMAVDLVQLIAGKPVWSGASMLMISNYMKSASVKFKSPLVWGGDWKGFVDPPHYQLDRKFYKEDHTRTQ